MPLLIHTRNRILFMIYCPPSFLPQEKVTSVKNWLLFKETTNLGFSRVYFMYNAQTRTCPSLSHIATKQQNLWNSCHKLSSFTSMCLSAKGQILPLDAHTWNALL